MEVCWREIHFESRTYLILLMTSKSTSALMGLWIFHHLMRGEVVENPPPPCNSAHRRRSEKPKKCARKPVRNYYESISANFFAKANIEVTRENLPQFHTSSEMCHCPRNHFGYEAGERAFDTSWAVLSLTCHQILANINGLGDGVKKCRNGFFDKNIFFL